MKITIIILVIIVIILGLILCCPEKCESSNMDGWQKLSKDTKRLKVPNGWIVVHTIHITDGWRRVERMQMCYVPDPEHKWELRKKQ